MNIYESAAKQMILLNIDHLTIAQMRELRVFLVQDMELSDETCEVVQVSSEARSMYIDFESKCFKLQRTKQKYLGEPSLNTIMQAVLKYKDPSDLSPIEITLPQFREAFRRARKSPDSPLFGQVWAQITRMKQEINSKARGSK